LYGAISQGATDVQSKVKLKDLSRRAIIENALYDQVNRFKCPDDVDKNNIMQWYMLNGNTIVDTFYFPMRQISNRAFDANRQFDANLFTIEYQSGVKFIKVSDPSLMFKYGTSTGTTYTTTDGTGLTISTADSLTDNGVWNVGGNITSLVSDNLTYITGSGSLRFNINDSTNTGSLYNDGLTAVDLSDHENKSTIFLSAYFPDSSLVTSLTLRWGSSTSVYFSRTATTPQFGSFRNGWNLIPFAWNGATETGTVDTSAIDYIRITPTLSASDTDIKFDNIFSALGEVREVVYYSKYLFRSTAGTWLEAPTDDSDNVVLDTDAENLFVYECIRLASLQIQGQGDIYSAYTNDLYGTNQKVGLYDNYKKDNPSEVIQPQTQHRRFGYNKK
jgi:hypothetical protein